ncbi:hypothetical protein M422DRAFT_30097 [Sphaerobolus stellatus SS14]|uniref:Carbohydrate-binding module family 19 domain-containing protein n=1 Tax=Sphaerobolus stellatus (strain SS14) TaxID=990650 RepID=A0A0C9W2I3_SPHS4|nr:hypothetical protein M422DRAFT_30097 [Sphaerobolus stellatus SS14]
MIFAPSFVAFLTLAISVQGARIPRNLRRQADAQSSLTLDPAVIQQSLAQNGLGLNDTDAGQTASLTSSNNFINFCLLFTNADGSQGELTDGKQKQGGSCNPTPMGTIPAKSIMPASKFQVPTNLQNYGVNQTFTITMSIINMQTGAFTNPNENYFAAPQQLNTAGQIIGHSHVVVQAVKSITDTTVADPTVFAFFKGMNAVAEDGVLTADVTNGLDAGTYRLCSINTAANHQPALVPVAQHGSLDDCVYFTVGDAAAQQVQAAMTSIGGVAAPAAAAPAAAASATADNATAAAPAPAAADNAAAAAPAPAADNATAAALPASPDASKPFLPSNGQDAQQLNAKFTTLTADSPCNAGDQACVGGGFAQCVSGKFVTTQCAGGTVCAALPLVNKAGTSITCTTSADAIARIAATGVTGGLTGSG